MNSNDRSYDLVIVGAGPAGMAAAVQACDLGLSVVLLDEQPRSGGQIYRNVGRQRLQNKNILGSDYQAGLGLLEQFRKSGCTVISNATVWQISDDKQVFYSVAGKSSAVTGGRVLLATGAQERPMPIPGWTLPGVMTAGAAQILLKSPGIAAEGAVFAGCGPLLYLIAWQYIQAGVKVKAVLDTTESGNYGKAVAQWRSALAGYRYLLKGIKLIAGIRQAGVPIVRGVTELEAVADTNGNLGEVHYRTKEGMQSLTTEHLFLHQGVIPQVNLAMASGCEVEWHQRQLCWQPKTGDWGESSRERIYIAGDAIGIGGAVAAALRGKLAALDVAAVTGRINRQKRDALAEPVKSELKRELGFRPFLEVLYRPADQFRLPRRDDAIVCRCEEISLADIRSAAEKGCMGPNQLKSFTRCGMGPCQGRQCGNTVSELMGQISGVGVESAGYYRLRAPVKPLNMSELASLADEH